MICQLATSSENLVASTQFLVALATSESQFQALMTNDTEVLQTIPEQDRSPRFLELTENKLPTDRALGIIWDAEEY